MMTGSAGRSITVAALDGEERQLVRLAAIVAAGDETQLRAQLARVVDVVRPVWVEEVLLQSYLFAGFPRTLNATREWRRASGRDAPADDDGEQFAHHVEWNRRGEETCRVVYGAFYDRLRHNIRELHPALDAWMIVEGYGKVLSRPGLDLARRELCVVAACSAARQERQLHSHLHGALHAGAAPRAIEAALDVVSDLLSEAEGARHRQLWTRVLSSHADVH
jgi:4-carboxymuconolactone decarboxylase